MSAQPTIYNYETWFSRGLATALPSWFGGPVGVKWGTATGQILDGPVGLLKQGVESRYPSLGPTDALSRIGSDRQLLQGANESETSFRTRLRDAWGQWSRAGTACSVLEQLFYFGFGSQTTYFLQPNGYAYTFSGDPTPGQDPTSLVVRTSLDTLTAALTSTVNPPTITSTGRSIPAGNPWIAFDSNVDITNRFAIVSTSWPFAALGVAVFSNSDTATVTWPFKFGDTSYNVVIGPPTDNVTLDGDASTVTTSGMTIDASAPWSGVAYVLAFETGVSPLNFLSAASVGTIQTVIDAFRPCARCWGVFAIQSGEMWDFPAGRTWDGDSNHWDGSSVLQILNSF